MRRLALVLTLAATSACVTGAQRQRRAAALRVTADHFTRALRWQRFDLCEPLVAPEVRESFRRRFVEREDLLRLMDVELSGVTFSEDGHQATVRVRVRWVLLPSIIEQVGTLEQRWEDRTGGWTLSRMEMAGGTGEGPLDLL